MQFDENHFSLLRDLLRWRRDVRHFQTTPIEPHVKSKLLQAVQTSPSVGNSRPWRFVEVNSPHVRAKVLQNHHNANDKAAKEYSDEDAYAHYTRLKLAGVAEAPLHLAVFNDPDPKAGKGLGRRTMPETLKWSTVIAIHQLWLCARCLNLGLGWVSILEPKGMNELLEVPEYWDFIGYLCLGYPERQSKTPELHEQGWQENLPETWLSR